MKRSNQQIEDAYAGSKRQGDQMRDPQIERSSSQDRRNRYRNGKNQVLIQYAFESDYRRDVQSANTADVVVGNDKERQVYSYLHQDENKLVDHKGKGHVHTSEVTTAFWRI